MLRRLLAWLYWVLRGRTRMRRAIDVRDTASVAIGDKVTVFDNRGVPHLAEVIRIDRWGRTVLVRDDNVVIDKVIA